MTKISLGKPLIKIPPHLMVVLMLGVLSQISQVLLLRELMMVFQGNELSIGLILAAWMLFVGVGSLVGGVLVQYFKGTFLLLTLNTLSLLIALPGTILLIRPLRGFLHVLPGAYLSIGDMAKASFLLLAPTCILIGIQFVLLTGIWRIKDQVLDTSSAEKTYIGEAVGNMIGGLLFTFFLVQTFNSLQIAFMIILLMITTLLSRSLYHSRDEIPIILYRIMLGSLLLGLLSLPLLGSLDSWAYKKQWQYFTPNHQLLQIHQSKHGIIAVVQSEDQYSFYQSAHRIFSTAGVKTEDPGLEEQEAVIFAHLSMLQHQRPESVLLIGGGLRGTLNEMVKYPVKKIHYLELDEALTKVALPYLSKGTIKTLEDKRVQILHTDGRLFVKGTQNTYDLIIIDVPDPSTAFLNRYYSLEFFKECQGLLHEDGVLVIGALSTPNLRGLAVANRNATIYHTLSKVFSHVNLAGEGFLFFFASNAPYQVTVDSQILIERYLEQDVESDSFSPYFLFSNLQVSRLERLNWIIENHGRSPYAHLEGPTAPPLFPGSLEEQEGMKRDLPPVEGAFFINSDFRPIAYFYTLMFWNELTRSGEGEAFISLLSIKDWWALPPLIITIPFILILQKLHVFRRKRTHTRFALLLTIFTTGFSTMALQVTLLFTFQSNYGFIYEMVGLVVAIFMGGLALGAFFSHHRIHNKTYMPTLAGVQLMMALWSALMAFLLPRTVGIQSPSLLFFYFSLLTLGAGAINGIDFPLATASFMALNNRAEKSAALVYAVELFGACLGAALTSTVIVPILGISKSCLLAALVSFVAGLVLMLAADTHLKGADLK